MKHQWGKRQIVVSGDPLTVTVLNENKAVIQRLSFDPATGQMTSSCKTRRCFDWGREGISSIAVAW